MTKTRKYGQDFLRLSGGGGKEEDFGFPDHIAAGAGNR